MHWYTARWHTADRTGSPSALAVVDTGDGPARNGVTRADPSDSCCTGDTDSVCGCDGADSHNVQDSDNQDGVWGAADGSIGSADGGDTVLSSGTCPY